MAMALSPPLIIATSTASVRICDWDAELDVFFPAEPRDDPDRPLELEVSSFVGTGIGISGESIPADLAYASTTTYYKFSASQTPVTIHYSDFELVSRSECLGATPVSNQPSSGWVYSFLLDDDTACAATGEELDEVAAEQIVLTDLCSLPGRSLLRASWEDELAALQ